MNERDFGKTCFFLILKLARTNKIIKAGKISGKYDIITVQDKEPSNRGNKTKKILEMNRWEREIEAWRFKAAKILMKKRIWKGIIIMIRYRWEKYVINSNL